MKYQDAKLLLDQHIDKIGSKAFIKDERVVSNHIIDFMIIAPNLNWMEVYTKMNTKSKTNEEALKSLNMLDDDLEVWVISEIGKNNFSRQTLNQYLLDLG